MHLGTFRDILHGFWDILHTFWNILHAFLNILEHSGTFCMHSGIFRNILEYSECYKKVEFQPGGHTHGHTHGQKTLGLVELRLRS